jgi:hypothetical protein
MKVHIETVPRTARILANQSSFVRFVDSLLYVRRFLVEFTADVDVGSRGIHSAASDKATFDKLVRITAENLAVLACSRFALISIDYKVPRSRILLPPGFVHKTPFQTTWKSCTSTSTEARVLDRLDDPGIAFEDNVFCTMPVAP